MPLELFRHIQLQLKIVIRYLDLVVGGVFVYLIAGILLVMLSQSYQLNVPLFCVVMAVFSTGPLFGNLFCEKPNEIRGYMLMPWSLRSVILSKNAALMIITLLFPLPIIFVTSFFIPSSAQDYFSAVIFFITSFPVFLLLGNMASVSQRTLASAQHVISPLQWGIVAVSPLPYLILKGWMNSVVLCIFFLGFSLIIWYVYQLPWVEKRYRTVIFQNQLDQL